MAARWWLILLCCLGPCAGWASPVRVNTQPGGARLRWSRADSPVMHDGGPAPATLDLPTGAGVVVEVTAPGHLPRFVPLDDGQRELAAALTPWRPELLRPLSDDGVEARPNAGSVDLLPAADGAGLIECERQPARPGALPGADLRWRPWAGPAITLVRFRREDGRDWWLWPQVAGSPDGRWVAYSGYGGGSGTWIAVQRRDGQGLRRVARYAGVEIDYPEWSADGAWLYYVAEARGDGEERSRRVLHRVDLRSGADEGLTTVAHGGVAVSPDGAQVACWRADGLAVLTLAGRGLRLVAPGWRAPADQRTVRWSPDGRSLACLKLPAGLPEGSDRGDTVLASVSLSDGRAVDLARPCRGFAWLPDSSGWLADAVAIALDGHVVADLSPPVASARAALWQPDSAGLLLLGTDRDGWPRAARLSLSGELAALPGPGFAAVWEALPTAYGWLVVAPDKPTWRYQGQARVARLTAAGELTWLTPPLPAPHSLSSTADGGVAVVLSGLAPRTQALRLAEPGPPQPIAGLPGDLESVAVSPDGRALALSRADECRVVDLAGTLLRAWPRTSTEPWRLRWTADSRGLTVIAASRRVLTLDGLADAPPRSPAELSPDRRWWVKLDHGAVCLAPTADMTQWRDLYVDGASRFGPWLYLARPLGDER